LSGRLDDLQSQVLKVRSHRLAVLGMDARRETARFLPFDSRSAIRRASTSADGALVERGVGDLEPRQLADVRLELEDRLKGALRDLRLVRRVRGQPLRAVQHLVRDRRDVVVVDAAAQEERGVARAGVLRREAAEEPADLDLRERRRQVRRLADLGRDVAKRSSIEETPIAASICSRSRSESAGTSPG
jgi:hypothetical protein